MGTQINLFFQPQWIVFPIGQDKYLDNDRIQSKGESMTRENLYQKLSFHWYQPVQMVLQ